MKKDCAPVAFFTYIRFKKLKRIINKLKKNDLSKKTDIFFFSDAAKNKNEVGKVNKVREYLKDIKGFKKKKIIFRNKNLGNGTNIIKGINEVFKKYDKIIVLEDDLEIGENFLTFMNNCLYKYNKNKKIWHVGGWTYDIKIKNKYDIFFSNVMNCWGWATWKNRWKFFEKNPKKLINYFNNNHEKKIKFNLNGNMNYFNQIVRNKNKKINTWAVFWYAQIFINNGLCISPNISLVNNNGFDIDSTQSHPDHFLNIIYKTKISKKKIFRLPDNINENLDYYKLLENFFRSKINFINKVKKILKKHIKNIL